MVRFGDIKYLFYKSNRRQLTIVSTMAGNVVLGAVYVVMSMIKLSLFLGFSGAINIVLALAKYYALERLLRLKTTDEKTKNTAEMKSIGKINNCTLICSFLFFSFGFVITFFYEDPANYEFWMIIYSAAISSLKILIFFVVALVNIKRRRGIKYYTRLMGGASTLISLAITQRAIMYHVDVQNPSVISGVGGMVFGLLAMLVGVYMIHKARKEKQRLLDRGLIDDEAEIKPESPKAV